MSTKDTAGARCPDSIETSRLNVNKKTTLRLPRLSTSGSNTKPPISERTGEVGKQRKNPFKLPADKDIFLWNQENEQRKQQESQRQRTLKVHEKSTYAGRIRANLASMRQSLKEEPDDVYHKSSRRTLPTLNNNPVRKKPATTGNRDSIRDYITKQRELFYTEYSLRVKKEVLQTLSEKVTQEEKSVRQAEIAFDKNETMFVNLIKEDEKNTAKAIKCAEDATNAKLEKMAEIRAISQEIAAVKSDISQHQQTLDEYSLYSDFLLKISPPEWQEKQQARKTTADNIKASIKQRETQPAETVKPGRRMERVSRKLPPVCDPRTPSRQGMMGTRETAKRVRKEVSVPLDESKLSEYEEPELYFTDPQQMIDLLADLEMQNLYLIQHSGETEETLGEMNHRLENTRKKMKQETDLHNQQVNIISHAIQREKDRAAELELKTRLFSCGENNSKDQDAMLEALGKKVVEVYRGCGGESGTNMDTLQTLTKIEGLMHDMLDKVEQVPKDLILSMTKAREKERRLRIREEKIQVQNIQLEKYRIKAQERSQAETKRPTGRRLMPRSLPPLKKQPVKKDDGRKDLELETYRYFYT
ncbi:hypothetical protein DPEC_G00098810 [Dallia pectoralis]|uniref:Uncharacterized protein n=1 Tax=Dallia pectoralis TaxID=75939 RepID=A0ACC2GW29_DALPE|nr:hypothetical protein DPEC_G00098810 [Dallia pectoralis]